MPENTNDVNTEVDSSTTSTEQTTDAKQTTATETSTEAKLETSPSEGLEKVVQDTFKKSISQVDKVEEKEEEKVETQVETTEKVEETKEEKVEKEEDKGPIPYDRFKEVNNTKVELETKMQELEPLVQAHRGIIEYCKQHDVSEEDFGYWLSIAAAAKTNPIEALKLLQPQLDAMKSVTGDSLPEDLKEAVDKGDITEAHARRLAAAEGRLKLTTKQQEKTQEQVLQQKQSEYYAKLHGGMNEWAAAKAVKDPDFKPKAKATDPNGKFEMVMLQVAELAKTKEVKDLASLLAVADEAYGVIESYNSRLTKPVVTRPRVSSTRTASTPANKPKTLEEVVANAAAKNGIKFNPVTA